MANNREAWLTKLAKRFETVLFKGMDIPKYRTACSFPSVRPLSASKRRVGECWSPSASEDQTIEILISPTMSNPMDVAQVLAHEMVHAIVGNEHGHKGPFRSLATAIGLEGKMTATTAGESFKATVQPILDKMTPYPHGRLSGAAGTEKKQSTRLIKGECPDCGYTIRITRMWIQEVGLPVCPACDLDLEEG